jgi:hypothetical protein
MPTVLQLRRGTPAQNDAFTGSAGELTFNTTTGALRAHDGTTAGGAEMLVNDGSNSASMVTLGGDLTVSGGDIILSGTGRIQGIDTVTDGTDAANKTYVDTAITNLIGGAPLALDTLNELAAAINDDASYASTITTALGTKAATATTISAGTGLTGGGDLSANRSFALATSGVLANTYGSSTAIPVITVDAYGRITSATTSSVTVGDGTITCATSGTGLSGSASFTLNQSGNTTFTVTSNATDANTASTIVARDASGNFTAGVITATTTAARYADLAEKYSADADYAPGTVVMFGGDAEVTAANEFATRKVAGVVSTEPAHIMNDALVAEHVITLALAGRVPCRVISVCYKGDLIVASDTAGVATAWNDVMRDPPAGSIIGKALENKTEANEGVIEVVVGVR